MDKERLEQQLQDYLQAEVQGIEPSPEWWDSAISRVSERKPSFWERYGTWLNRPLWRAVIPVALVVVLAIGVLWRTGILPQYGGMAPAPVPAPTIPAPTVPLPVITVPPPLTPTPAPVPAPAPSPPTIVVSAVTAKTVYLPGETVEVVLLFRNRSTQPVTISPFPPTLRISRTPDTLVRNITSGNEAKVVNPGETTSYTVIWDGKDDDGKQATPGWHYFSVKGTWGMAKILIQYPQGAMEKTIEPKQSKTVNGISIILERVELTATGMKVYAFNTPPGYYYYQLPSGGGMAPSFWVRAEAEYGIDEGAFQTAGESNFRPLENGMLHIWNWLDPVPGEARELTFRINKLGDWTGPWEFKIPLK